MFDNLGEFIRQVVDNWTLMRSEDQKLGKEVRGLKKRLHSVESEVDSNSHSCADRFSKS